MVQKICVYIAQSFPVELSTVMEMFYIYSDNMGAKSYTSLTKPLEYG